MTNTRSPRARLRDVVVIASFCALAAGGVEAGVMAFHQAVKHEIVFVSYDFAWMTPAAFLLLVVPVTIVVHSALVAARRPLALSTLLGLLTTVLVLSMLLPYTAIAWWASGILAAGAGFRVSRLAAGSDAGRWIPALRASAIVLATLMAAAGVSVRATRAWSERQATTALPAPAPGAPNVLLVVLDAVRSSNLGLYGYGRPTTPELQRWAADAIVFDRAMATAPWTLPSHGSLFTGRAPDTLQVGWRKPLSDAPRTLAEALGSHGYASAGFVANLLYTSYESGLSRGFVHYDDYRVSWPLLFVHSSLTRFHERMAFREATSWRETAWALARFPVAPGGLEPADIFRPADQVAAAFLDWQRTISDRPFFAFLNFYDAHGPYRAPEAFLQQFARAPGSTVDRYDAAIAWSDHVIGTVLDSLKQRGVLDRTIVIVTSDHGEHFGEHGLVDHANSLYLPLLHVPLMIRYPAGLPAGRRVDTLVSLRDLPATILDIAGIKHADFPGTSLSQTWRQPGLCVQGDIVAELIKGINVDPAFRNYRGDAVARLDERFHYIRNGDGTEELFEYRIDPQERRNLVKDPARHPDVVRLRTGLPMR